MSSKAYEIILRCLFSAKKISKEKNPYVRNLKEALAFFSFSINRYLEMDTDLPRALEKEFDLDNIINFSDAWSYWDDMYDILFNGKHPKPALDQLLFSGKHINSKKYFQGIESLANKNVKQSTDMLTRIVPENFDRRMVDLGAGSGIYSKAFIRAGIVRESCCLDLPYVVEQYNNSKETLLSWHGVDLFQYKPQQDEKYGLIFLANVLHHYDQKKIAHIFRNISSAIDKESFLVIQDYLLWPKPAFSPIYASALGIHFALTTEGGRCYTGAEIVSLVQKNLRFMKFYARINTRESDLIIFKNG